MSAIVAVQYRTTFQGSIDQSGLRALAENPAIRILFGPPVALDDAGGFTVWRTGTRCWCSRAYGCCWPPSALPAVKKRPDGGTFCWPAGCAWSIWSCAAWWHSPDVPLIISVGRRGQPGGGRYRRDRGVRVRHRHPWRDADLRQPPGCSPPRSCRPGPPRSVSPWACWDVGLMLRMLADGCACTGMVSVDDPVRPHRTGRAVRGQPDCPAARPGLAVPFVLAAAALVHRTAAATPAADWWPSQRAVHRGLGC